MARLLAAAMRGADFVARTGGEAFIVLLPGTSAAQGLMVAEKLRLAVQDTGFRCRGEPARIPLSYGVAAPLTSTRRKRCSCAPTPPSARPRNRAATAACWSPPTDLPARSTDAPVSRLRAKIRDPRALPAPDTPGRSRMPNVIEPVTGNWYRDAERDDEFEVTALDATGGSVEIQWADGTVEEIDMDAWYALDLELIEDEDWEEDEEDGDDGWGDEEEDADADDDWSDDDD